MFFFNELTRYYYKILKYITIKGTHTYTHNCWSSVFISSLFHHYSGGKIEFAAVHIFTYAVYALNSSKTR